MPLYAIPHRQLTGTDLAYGEALIESGQHGRMGFLVFDAWKLACSITQFDGHH